MLGVSEGDVIEGFQSYRGPAVGKQDITRIPACDHRRMNSKHPHFSEYLDLTCIKKTTQSGITNAC
jgi:hypothetical protein